MVAKLRTLKIN